MTGNKFETTATECSGWEEWLHDAVDEASDVADKLDWSTEQVLAYAILQARSQAYIEFEEMIISEQGNFGDEWSCERLLDAIRSKANQ